MARITVEDCLERQSNRFALVRLASRRAKQLLSGDIPVIDTKGNKAIVSALREIADGRVRFRRADIEGDGELDGEQAPADATIV
jgi:DNA-directed RNA polymerase subunit omega